MPADYYELLGVERDADERTIKRSFRALAMQHHPDRNPGDCHAEERFKQVSEAYEVLSDPEKREIYDQYGHDGLKGRGFDGFQASSFEDIFSHFGDLFGDLFGGGRRARARGADVRHDVEVTLVECLNGVQKILDIPREVECDTCRGSGARPGTQVHRCATCGGVGQVQVARGFITMATPCPRCRGRGKSIPDPCADCAGAGRQARKRQVRVQIPAGVDNGMKLRLTGQGEPGPNGSSPGDLYLFIQVPEDARFERHGPDLLTEVGIDLVQACLGDKVSVETLEGVTDVEIAAGTQPGTMLRLRGRGLPRLESHGRGDLHVRVRVDIPRGLSPEQAKLLKEFRSRAS